MVWFGRKFHASIIQLILIQNLNIFLVGNSYLSDSCCKRFAYTQKYIRNMFAQLYAGRFLFLIIKQWLSIKCIVIFYGHTLADLSLKTPDKDYYILYTPKSHLTEPEHQHLINVHKQRNGP